MNDHDTPDPARSPVGQALDELAATMPDQPAILDGVYTRIDRYRRRRHVARVAGGAGACVLLVAGVLFVRTATTEVATPASAPATTPAAGTACSGSTENPADTTDANAADNSPDAAQKKAAAAAADAGVVPSDAVARKQADAALGETRMKMIGTIVGTPDGDILRVRPDAEAQLPDELQVTLVAATEYRAGGNVSTRPTLTDGQRVALGLHMEGAEYVVDILDSQPDNPVSPSPDESAAVLAKGIFTVTARQGLVVTLQPRDPVMPIGTVTADLGSVRLLHGDGTPCSTVDLSVGQSVGAMVVRGAPGEAWTVRDIVFS